MIGDVINMAAAFSMLVAIGAAGYFLAALICTQTPGGVAHAVNDLVDYFRPSGDDYVIARRARQVVFVLSTSGLVAMANMINVAVASWAMWQVGVSANVFMWAAVILVAAGLQLESCMRLRGKTIDAGRSPAIVRRIIVNALVFGGCWGLGAAMFMDEASNPATLILLLALCGIAAAGVATLAAVPPAAILFAAAVGFPVFCTFLEAGEGPYRYLAVYVCVYFFALGAIASGVYNVTVKRPALAELGRESECGGVKCAVQLTRPASGRNEKSAPAPSQRSIA